MIGIVYVDFRGGFPCVSQYYEMVTQIVLYLEWTDILGE